MRIWPVLMIGCVFVGGCSLTQPFVDMRREAGVSKPVGYATPDRPAVCYNSWVTSVDEADVLAQEFCQKTNRHAVFQDENAFSCRLLTPRVRFYQCER